MLSHSHTATWTHTHFLVFRFTYFFWHIRLSASLSLVCVYVHVSKINTNTYRQFVSWSPTRCYHGTHQYDRWRGLPWGEFPSRNLQVDTPHIYLIATLVVVLMSFHCYFHVHMHNLFSFCLLLSHNTPHTWCQLFIAYRRQDSRSPNHLIFKSIAHTDFAICIHMSRNDFLANAFVCIYMRPIYVYTHVQCITYLISIYVW